MALCGSPFYFPLSHRAGKSHPPKILLRVGGGRRIWGAIFFLAMTRLRLQPDLCEGAGVESEGVDYANSRYVLLHQPQL